MRPSLANRAAVSMPVMAWACHLPKPGGPPREAGVGAPRHRLTAAVARRGRGAHDPHAGQASLSTKRRVTEGERERERERERGGGSQQLPSVVLFPLPKASRGKVGRCPPFFCPDGWLLSAQEISVCWLAVTGTAWVTLIFIMQAEERMRGGPRRR